MWWDARSSYLLIKRTIYLSTKKKLIMMMMIQLTPKKQSLQISGPNLKSEDAVKFLWGIFIESHLLHNIHFLIVLSQSSQRRLHF